ncbi:hypothetical protein BHM03_00030151 [Ensete ventricosum]|nr:hypothetical protein BHM03_00030151 [Ensete ventricosum]
MGAGCQDGWREPLRREEPAVRRLARDGRSKVGSSRRQQVSSCCRTSGIEETTEKVWSSAVLEQQIWFG